MRERTGMRIRRLVVAVAQRKISEIVIAMRRCPQPIVAPSKAQVRGGFAWRWLQNVRVTTPDSA